MIHLPTLTHYTKPSYSLSSQDEFFNWVHSDPDRQQFAQEASSRHRHTLDLDIELHWP